MEVFYTARLVCQYPSILRAQRRATMASDYDQCTVPKHQGRQCRYVDGMGWDMGGLWVLVRCAVPDWLVRFPPSTGEGGGLEKVRRTRVNAYTSSHEKERVQAEAAE